MRYFTVIRGVVLILVLGGTPLLSFAEGSGGGASTPSITAQSGEEQSLGVNINTASAEELADGLVGVGLKRAAAIIEYRELNGGFSDKAELLEVKGIGDSIFNKNKAIITL